MKTILFISLILISTISFTNQSGVILYTDVTASNFPIQAVTGPTMDAAAGDLDNDGDADIVLAREFAPNKILINNGSGQFTDGTLGNLPQFNYDSEDIGIADFNGDGFNDIVFASEDNAIHELYFNNGNGSFSNLNNRLPSSTANAVLAEDINNDSLPDIILGNAGQDFILINNGDSTFTNETAQRLPSESNVNQDLKLADIDGDGDKDLIAGNEDGNKIYINNGSGLFTNETVQRLPPSSTEETRKVTLGDVDGDQDLDLFFANVAFIPGRTTQDRLLLNNGIGIFTDVTSTNLPVDNEQTTEGIFADIDFDNDLDLITSNIFFNRQMKIFLNNGSGFFYEATNTVLPPNTVAEGIGVFGADLNNDGLTDLYLQNRRTSQQTTETDRLLIRNDTGTVQILNNENINPLSIKLHQNFPNPFNPETIIKYELSEAGYTELKIYDILGKQAVELVNSKQSPGEYSVKFDGSRLAGGVYYYKLSVNGGDNVITKKLVLLK